MIFPVHLNYHISLPRRPWAMDVANPSSDFEAPKDPGAHKAFASVTDNEILGESENDYDNSTQLKKLRCVRDTWVRILYKIA